MCEVLSLTRSRKCLQWGLGCRTVCGSGSLQRTSPGSALRSLSSVALSSDQAPPLYTHRVVLVRDDGNGLRTRPAAAPSGRKIH